MRKLKQAEVAALVAGMAIGSANLHAMEPTQPLATVTVTGTYESSYDFIYSASNYVSVDPGQPPNYVGTLPSTSANGIQHAMSCALAYGSLPGMDGGSWAQPKPGWETFFVNSYAWTNYNGIVFETSQSSSEPPGQPPGGGAWYTVDGTTVPNAGNPYVQGITTVYLNAFSSMGLLVNTFAHEWSHQWGLSDNPATPGDLNEDAEAYGDAVEKAYLADNGKKCGGL